MGLTEEETRGRAKTGEIYREREKKKNKEREKRANMRKEKHNTAQSLGKKI